MIHVGKCFLGKKNLIKSLTLPTRKKGEEHIGERANGMIIERRKGRERII